jgi:hypothetical protein
MANPRLQSVIPIMCIPLPTDHQFFKVQTAHTTAAYTGGSSESRPDQKSCPAFLIHDASLPDHMLQSLKSYIESSPRRDRAPSVELCSSVHSLHRLLAVFTLGHVSTTKTLFERLFIPISYAVQDVDANVTLPEAATQVATHNQIPDSL